MSAGKGDARRPMLIDTETYARNFSRTFEPEVCQECEGRGIWVETHCARLHRGAACPDCAEVEVTCEECDGRGATWAR